MSEVSTAKVSRGPAPRDFVEQAQAAGQSIDTSSEAYNSSFVFAPKQCTPIINIIDSSMQIDHGSYTFSSPAIRKNAQGHSLTSDPTSSLPSPWTSPTSSSLNLNVFPDNMIFSSYEEYCSAPTPEYSPVVNSAVSPTSSHQYGSFSSPGLLDDLPYEGCEGHREQAHTDRMKVFLESESIRKIQETEPVRQLAREVTALKDESEALPDVIDYTGALNDPTWPPPDTCGPPKPAFDCDFQLIADDASTTHDILELFDENFRLGRADSAIDGTEPYGTSATLTLGSDTLDYVDESSPIYGKHCLTSVPVEAIRQNLISQRMIRYPSDSGLGISGSSYQVSPYSEAEALASSFSNLNGFPPLPAAGEIASGEQSLHQSSSPIESAPSYSASPESNTSLFPDTAALGQSSGSSLPQTTPRISPGGIRTIDICILKPLKAIANLKGFGPLLHQASQRLRSDGPDRFSCLRDLEKFLLVERGHIDTTADAYFQLCKTFFQLITDKVIAERRIPEGDLCRQSDPPYNAGYVLDEQRNLEGRARRAFGTQHGVARIAQNSGASRGVLKGGAWVQNQASAAALPLAGSAGSAGTADSNKRPAPGPNATSHRAKKPKVDAPGSELLPSPEQSAKASAKLLHHSSQMSLTGSSQPASDHSSFDPKHLHPGRQTLIESNVGSPSSNTSFTFDAKHGIAVREETVRQEHEYRSSTAFSASTGPRRIGFVPERKNQQGHYMSSTSQANRKAGKTAIKALKCEKCSKRFERQCDLRKHGKTHDRPHKCEVHGCKYQKVGFSAEKDRDRHYQDKHNKNSVKHQCDYQPCDYSSTRLSNVKQHMEKTHGYRYERTKTVLRRPRTEKGSTIPATAPTSSAPPAPPAPPQLATPETYPSTSPSDFAIDFHHSPAMSDGTSIYSHNTSPQFDIDDCPPDVLQNGLPASSNGASYNFFPPLEPPPPVSYLSPSLIHEHALPVLPAPIDTSAPGYQTVQQATSRISRSPPVTSAEQLRYSGLKQQADPNMALGDEYDLSNSPGERAAFAEAMNRDPQPKLTGPILNQPPEGVLVETVDFDHKMDRMVARDSRS